MHAGKQMSIKRRITLVTNMAIDCVHECDGAGRHGAGGCGRGRLSGQKVKSVMQKQMRVAAALADRDRAPRYCEAAASGAWAAMIQ